MNRHTDRQTNKTFKHIDINCKNLTKLYIEVTYFYDKRQTKIIHKKHKERIVLQ